MPDSMILAGPVRTVRRPLAERLVLSPIALLAIPLLVPLVVLFL